MNRLGKCIKLNFGMVENEIAIICVMGGSMLFCALGFALIFIVLILAVVLVVFLVKMYKKLFYTSIYGETAPMYQSLPVPVEDMVLSKIFTAGTGLLMSYATTNILCILVAVIVHLYDSVWDLLIETAEINPDASNIGVLLILELIKFVFAIYRQSVFVFMAVVLYNSLLKKRKKGSTKVLIFAIAGVVHFGIISLDKLLGLLGAEPTAIWIPAVCIVLDIFLTVVFYRITVKLLKEKYALN